MTDLQILEHALFKMNVGYENISNKLIEITPKTESRMEYSYENSVVFEFDENGNLKSIMAQGE